MFLSGFKSRCSVQRKTGCSASVGQVRSGYPITVPEARYAVGDPLLDEPQGFFYLPKINNGRLPPYTNFGLQGAYQFEWGAVGIQFKLEINNLTFRRNVIRRIYDPMVP